MEDISESLIDETPSNNSSNVIPYDPRRRYEELLEQVERLGHFSTKTFCVNSSKLEMKVSFTTNWFIQSMIGSAQNHRIYSLHMVNHRTHMEV